MLKRDIIANVARLVGADSMVRAATHRIGANTLTVVNYHRVNAPDAARRFDEGTLDASPQGFSAQIAFLKRNYTLLDPNLLPDLLSGSRPWPRRAALITFDDGYLDNHDCALPILQDHGAKALFFIACDYVERRKLYWWDRVSNVLKRSTKHSITLDYPTSRTIDLSQGTAKPERELHRLVKRTPELDLAEFLARLTEAAGVTWDDRLEREYADELVMTWSHVKALRAAGMTIGSHTRTHRVLDTLPTSELDAELSGSRQDLEEALGEEVWAIAYPVGYPVSHIPEIRSALERAGYQVGFTYNTGVQCLVGADHFNMARLGVERSWSLARFSCELLFQRPWFQRAAA